MSKDRFSANNEISKPVIEVSNFNFYYGAVKSLNAVNMKIQPKTTTAFIGPSGCGKSTLLRNFNRMNDLIEGSKMEGDILLHGESIYRKNLNVTELRSKVGMVFQKSNPFPMTIFENIAYAPLKKGIKKKSSELTDLVEESLRGAALWDEVKDKLHKSALGLSGGQQQRLCIARVLAMKPEIILMDEPCSALDPISTMKIENLIAEIEKEYTIVIVTHNMQQAARVSSYTAFMYVGELVEYNSTTELFSNPVMKQTEDYITGRFG
ncbi:MAG: phosphate ABC transporter ATP-binding protein [Spirochaetes bacterium]|nr:phosphate ABC transporter ATP-binding protein [Spirochaetota bacterium]